MLDHPAQELQGRTGHATQLTECISALLSPELGAWDSATKSGGSLRNPELFQTRLWVAMLSGEGCVSFPLYLAEADVLKEPQWHGKARMSSLGTCLGNDSNGGGVCVPVPLHSPFSG